MLKLFNVIFLAFFQPPGPPSDPPPNPSVPPLIEECYEDVHTYCEPPQPCADKKCVKTGTRFFTADTNLDGVIGPGEGYSEPIYQCKESVNGPGHVGTYRNAISWVGSIKKAEVNGQPIPGSKNQAEATTIYCFKKKGCPTNSCTEHTNVTTPSETVFFCSDPSQTGVDDDPHEHKPLRDPCGIEVADPT